MKNIFITLLVVVSLSPFAQGSDEIQTGTTITFRNDKVSGDVCWGTGFWPSSYDAPDMGCDIISVGAMGYGCDNAEIKGDVVVVVDKINTLDIDSAAHIDSMNIHGTVGGSDIVSSFGGAMTSLRCRNRVGLPTLAEITDFILKSGGAISN